MAGPQGERGSPQGHAQPRGRRAADCRLAGGRVVAGGRPASRAVVASGPGWPHLDAAVRGGFPCAADRRPPRRRGRPGAGRPGGLEGLGPGPCDPAAGAGAGGVPGPRDARPSRGRHGHPPRVPAAVPVQPSRVRAAARADEDHHEQARRALGDHPAAAGGARLFHLAGRRFRLDGPATPGRPVIPNGRWCHLRECLMRAGRDGAAMSRGPAARRRTRRARRAAAGSRRSRRRGRPAWRRRRCPRPEG